MIINNKFAIQGHYVNSYVYNNINRVYLNYFVEGVSDIDFYNNSIGLKLKSYIDDAWIYFNDNVINYFTSEVNPSLIYEIQYGNYYKKTFKYNSSTNSFNNMVRGEIFGGINLIQCGLTNAMDLKVLCYRSDDRQFIGEYLVTNGQYNIPNLDVNSRYDIILIDKTRTIEQQVHSYRQPTEKILPQTFASKPNNFKIDMLSSFYTFIKYDIKKELYKDWDYLKLIYMGVGGNLNEVVIDKITCLEGNYCLYRFDMKAGYYRLDSYYKDKITSSDLYEIKNFEHININIPTQSYTPPQGDDINIIIGE